MMKAFENRIFGADTVSFEPLALELFDFQYRHNDLYRAYTDTLGVVPRSVRTVSEIPFLPVSFFKTHPIRTTKFDTTTVFESSGTTQTLNSRHFVKDPLLYRESFVRGFEIFYGPVTDWCIIGLLPAYLERQHSSLVVMAEELIRLSGHALSGFYLYEHAALYERLRQLEHRGQKTLIIGVTFALLDFAEKYSLPPGHLVVMETGGMKGRRREMTRPELHEFLMERLGLSAVHSEYGMTELLSQAYSSGEGIFRSVPWMRALVRNDDDPLVVEKAGEGILNIIDLANLYSCSFIATDDLGKVYSDGSFQVSGRVDNSDIRGCSLLVL